MKSERGKVYSKKSSGVPFLFKKEKKHPVLLFAQVPEMLFLLLLPPTISFSDGKGDQVYYIVVIVRDELTGSDIYFHLVYRDNAAD